MKWFNVVLIALGIWAGSPEFAPAQKIGDTEAEVIKALGEPNSRAKMGEKELFMYHKKIVELYDGTVRKVKINAPSPNKKSAVKQSTPPKRPSVKASNTLGDAPAEVKAKAIKGTMTVVIYGATWCPGCKRLDSMLKTIQKSNNDFKITKVNIKNWEDPIAKRLKIAAIPAMYVFSAEGRLVANPDTNPQQTLAIIAGK